MKPNGVRHHAAAHAFTRMMRFSGYGFLILAVLLITSAASAAGSYAYITNFGAMTVSVIDTTINAVGSSLVAFGQFPVPAAAPTLTPTVNLPFTILNPYQRVPSGEYIVPPGSNLSEVVNASRQATPTPTPFPVTPTPTPAPTATPTPEPTIIPTPPPPGIPTPVPLSGIEWLTGLGIGAILCRVFNKKQ